MKLSRWEWIIICVGFVLTVFYGYGQKLDGDVTQLFDRAIALIDEGRLIPYGPATSSGASGHVPGAFMTLAVGLPMLIYPSPWMSLGLLSLLHFIAYLMLRSIIKPHVSQGTLVFLGLMFWLNPYRASEVFLWNPGYMFFAAVLHFWTLNKLVNNFANHSLKHESSRTFLWSTLHVLSLFLAAQIHPSVIILGGISFLLWFTGRVRVSWWGIATGFVLGLSSLTPFFIEALQNPEVFPKPGNSEGHLFYGLLYVHPMLKAIWYWILFGSFISQSHVFHKTTFSWIELQALEVLVKILFQAIKYFFAVVGVILSFYFNILFAKTYSPLLQFWRKPFWKYAEPKSLRPFFVDYAATAFLVAVAAAALSPASTQYWHVLYVMPTALIPIIWGFDQLIYQKDSLIFKKALESRVCLSMRILGVIQSFSSREQKLKLIALLLGVYFVIFNFFGALESRKYDWSESFHQRFENYKRQ